MTAKNVTVKFHGTEGKVFDNGVGETAEIDVLKDRTRAMLVGKKLASRSSSGDNDCQVLKDDSKVEYIEETDKVTDQVLLPSMARLVWRCRTNFLEVERRVAVNAMQ